MRFALKQKEIVHMSTAKEQHNTPLDDPPNFIASIIEHRKHTTYANVSLCVRFKLHAENVARQNVEMFRPVYGPTRQSLFIAN